MSEHSDPLWRIELFGRLRARRADHEITRFGSRRAAELLGYLALTQSVGTRPRQSHPREALIELLWPECEPRTGRNRLNQTLSSLRRQLEPPDIPPGAVIHSEREWVGLNPATVVTDVAEFHEVARSALGVGCEEERVARLLKAVELYQGALLLGCEAAWVVEEQAWLQRSYFDALHRLLADLERAGETQRAIEVAERGLRIDPLREELRRELIRLLAAAGRPRAALDQYEEWKRVLERELGEAPEAETVVLVDRIRREAASSGVARRASPAASDGRQTIGIGSAQPSREPAPVARPDFRLPEEPRPELQGYLPPRLNRFFGREAELAWLSERLQPPAGDSQPRLVTLTGTGGSGKTRLAIEVAARLKEAWQGAVWFVPLLELTDPRFIIDKIRSVLRLPGDVPGEPFEQVVAFLRRQPALLVLDNYDHLLSSHAEELRRLLEQVPGLAVLVTSRHRLGLPGEQQLALAPLSVPEEEGVGGRVSGEGLDKVALAGPHTLHRSPHTLLGCASVALFIDRAQAVKPDFQLTTRNAAAIAALCRRLEGLPLAIELAAARIGVTTPQQMLARLATRFDFLQGRSPDADPRHRSLRATLDWSYQFLPPELQRFFVQLSVFRGGWTADAAAAVCDQPDALEFLQQLQDSSLVQSEVTETETVRFSLLETLREFGDEQLEADERAALRQRHARYFREVARDARRMLEMGSQVAALRWMRQEHENFRTALAWGLSEEGDPELALETSALLFHHWQVTGRMREALTYLEPALARAGSAGDPGIRRTALICTGQFTGLLQEFSRARAYLEQALALARQHGGREETAWVAIYLTEVLQPAGEYEVARSLAVLAYDTFAELNCLPGRAWAMLRLGHLAAHRGEAQAAGHWFENALASERRAKSSENVAIMRYLNALGGTVLARGDTARARALYEEELEIARHFDKRDAIADSLGNLAGVDEYEGEYDRAAARYAESLAISRRCGNPSRMAWALLDMAGIRRRQGDLDAASRYLDEARLVLLELEARLLLGVLRMYEAEVATARCEWEVALPLYGGSLEIWLELADPRHVPRCLDGLARLKTSPGLPQRAARLLGTAAALRRSLGQPQPRCDQPETERLVAGLRAALGEAAFDIAWRDGEATPWEQVAAAVRVWRRCDAAPAPHSAVTDCEPHDRLPLQGDLTDAQWERVRPLLPPEQGRRGRPFGEHRRVINGILWVLRTGVGWRDMPAQYGKGKSCHERYRLWRLSGLWERIERALQEPAGEP